MQSIYLTIVLSPLLACLIAGLFGKTVGRVGAHSITILGVGLSCVLSFYVLYQFLFNGLTAYNGTDAIKSVERFAPLAEHLIAVELVQERGARIDG